ncbi:hypothetical protein N9505_02135 [Candidatus Thioglobus sp.]|jgi:hypothetical protein|nr:hypothetical protein [Candidatus Thioglobus sp.]MDB4026177.1 hypothetical protein [Candidatus Thioglobus sp.]
MKVISNFEVTKGYEVWKKAFESNEATRQKNNVRVLAFGHEKGNESNVYTVVEMNSIEDKQLKEPNMIESRKNAGVNHASLKITSLVE